MLVSSKWQQNSLDFLLNNETSPPVAEMRYLKTKCVGAVEIAEFNSQHPYQEVHKCL